MFSSQKFLSSLAKGLYKRLLYYPSAGNRHGFVTDFNSDIIILSDYRPKSLGARRAFWRRFVLSCAPQTIELIAATPIARVFKIKRRKWGLFLFIDNNIAVEMIRKSGLKISTWVSPSDGEAEGGSKYCVLEMPFFGKVLDLMPDEGGMYIVTDHSPYLFQGDSWGKPRQGDFRFVIGDNIYASSLISDRAPGFRNRACEFIIRKKCQVNEVKDPIPRTW